MKRVLAVSPFILLVALAGAVRAQDEAKNDLPEKIKWDVKLFEDDKESFTVVKRTVDKNGPITWVLEVNAGAAAKRMNDYGTFNTLGYFANFLDEDGVVIHRAKIATEPASGVRKGDRVRAVLKMPAADVVQKTQKVVIVYVE